MQFHITTDYAIRIMGYLITHKNELATATEMSKELGITYQYFMKVINHLKKNDLIQSVQGCKGGYQIAPGYESLTLYDVVVKMEGEIKINRCLANDCFCSMNATSHCPVHKVFEQIQEDLIISLRKHNLTEIMGAN